MKGWVIVAGLLLGLAAAPAVFAHGVSAGDKALIQPACRISRELEQRPERKVPSTNQEDLPTLRELWRATAGALVAAGVVLHQ